MHKEAAAHGGNIYKKAKELGIPESSILDFSANISPLGTPKGIKEAIVNAVDGVILIVWSLQMPLQNPME